MSGIRLLKNKYRVPRMRWNKSRIMRERKLVEKYGLKNKRELWILENMLSKKMKAARNLFKVVNYNDTPQAKNLIKSLVNLNILSEDAVLENVLEVRIEDLLERRLQTLVYRKGLANTIKQARQFITHGHIAINGKRVTRPGYLVKRGEDELISYYDPSFEEVVRTMNEKKETKEENKESEDKQVSENE